jgi:succinate-semialdehyde dehydrogenase/glutarate-semialdehyde dehydrogenase
MKVWQEEVFGPVLPVVSFETEEEAIELANDTSYGLGSYIFTKDETRMERVASQIQAGMVSQNNLTYFKPSNPFGGYKSSGLGREHGKYGFHDVTQVKVVVTEK